MIIFNIYQRSEVEVIYTVVSYTMITIIAPTQKSISFTNPHHSYCAPKPPLEKVSGN